MSQQQHRVYYDLLTRVGNNGRYQTIALWIILGICILGGSSFFVNTYLFYQNPYTCKGAQSTACTQYVCSLPPHQRVSFESPQHLYSLGNQKADYFCQGQSTVTFLQEGILIGGSVGVVAVVIFSDAIGRRLTILSSMIMAFVGILLTQLVPFVQVKFLGLLMWGAGADISFAVAASSITEIVAEENRAISYVGFIFAFTTGIILNPIIYYLLGNYLTVGYYYYGLGYLLLSIFFYKYVESPPLQIISKIDDPSESYEAFMRIAKLNGVQDHGITSEEIQILHQKYRDNQKEKDTAPFFTFIDIFRYKSLRGDFLKVCFVFFVILFLQYAPILLSSKLVPNIFLAGIANGVSQYLSIPFLPYLNANVSRIKGLVVTFGLTVIFIFLQWVVDQSGCISCVKGTDLVLLMAFFFASRFFISVFTSFNFNVLNESFPAQVRSICYCGALGVARISTIFIPLLSQLKYATKIPYNLMFAFVGLVGMIGCFFLRETLNIPPPEIIEELRMEETPRNTKDLVTMNNAAEDLTPNNFKAS